MNQLTFYPFVYRELNGKQFYKAVFEQNRFSLYIWFDSHCIMRDFQLIKDNEHALGIDTTGQIQIMSSETPEITAEEAYKSESKFMIAPPSNKIREELLNFALHMDCADFPLFFQNVRDKIALRTQQWPVLSGRELRHFQQSIVKN